MNTWTSIAALKCFSMASRDKYLRVMRERGMPFYTNPEETRKRLIILRESHGMSYRQIASAAGINKSVVGDILLGASATVTRETAQRIAAVRPLNAPTDTGRLQGARRPAAGVRRRLDAMTLEGWSYPALSELCGLSQRSIGLIMTRGRTQATPVVIKEIAGAYAFTELHPAASRGVEERQQARAIRAAMFRNAAPRHCWDEDTIDDPQAIAEWTGECGTTKGYEIHLRENQRFWDADIKTWRWGCKPCRKAQAEKNAKWKASHARG